MKLSHDQAIRHTLRHAQAEATLARIEMEAQVHASYLEYRVQEGIPEKDR